MNQKVSRVFRRGLFQADVKISFPNASASNIRKSFLDFFCIENNHFYVPSSPVFSLLDPTLAFVNAGMNQFKNVFLGQIEPAAPRMANSQKCIRVGGKHNDLTEVGQDGTHHSFFEMLGNWSFGDYFKKEACEMSWNLLTKVYNLPPEKLYVTYFRGNDSIGLDPDFEVREIWRELGIKESHILPFGMKDNFWEMATTGPCGVCTEIHYDHVPGRREAGHLVNTKGGDVSELWNLVFTQYDRKENGSLEKLSKHFVDTGMGFERLVAVLQNKISNYDTDLFLPIFDVIARHSGHSGYSGSFGTEDLLDFGYRVLADHGRMITAALADGMIPNHQNKVRTIIRRAVDICEKTFRSDQRLLTEVMNCVAETLADAYPQMTRNLSKMQYMIEEEVDLLKRLQKNALKNYKKYKSEYPEVGESDLIEAPRLFEALQHLKQKMKVEGNNEDMFSLENTWILFDTFGIPVKIVEKIAERQGKKFDLTSFDEYCQKLKEAAKQSTNKKLRENAYKKLKPETVSELGNLQLRPSKDYFKNDYWIDDYGKYVFPEQPATVQAIIHDQHVLKTFSAERLKEAGNGGMIGLVLDRTNFCASTFNRVSDSGILSFENGVVFHVENVIRFRNSAIHYGTFSSFPSHAELFVNDEGILTVNEKRRLGLMRNHTALNLLKAGVRQKLEVTGEKYSMVYPNTFALGIMLYKDNFELEDVMDVEKTVNQIIRHDVRVQKRPLPFAQFHSMEDVVFLPGVDLIESEISVFEVNSGFTLIREHCTGTHVLNTGDVKDFAITKFSKASYGVKRFEGVTGEEAVAVRAADLHVQENWETIKWKIDGGFLKDDDVAFELKNFRKDLSSRNDLSYIVRTKIMKDIGKLSSNKKNN